MSATGADDADAGTPVLDVAASDSGAADDGDTADARAVNYVFPVTVVVVGALSVEDYEAIDRRIWSAFSDAIRNV
ncbi:MAG: hypothetical protein P4M09_03070 [Devosia sp.]|nr:hypothetical protein [Devosia sp.]